KSALPRKLHELFEILVRQRLAEALVKGGADFLNPALAVELMQQERLLFADLERLSGVPVAHQVLTAVLRRPGNELGSSHGENGCKLWHDADSFSYGVKGPGEAAAPPGMGRGAARSGRSRLPPGCCFRRCPAASYPA